MAAALILFTAVSASAQEVNATASITIPTLLQISVDQPTVTFTQPAFSDYDAGTINSGVTSLIDTRGNVLHDVSVKADVGTMTYAGTGTNPNKPVTDLQWSANAGTSWNDLSTTAANVVASLARGTNNDAASVTYRMKLNEASDVPGTYSLGFTYTVVAN